MFNMKIFRSDIVIRGIYFSTNKVAQVFRMRRWQF